MQLNKLLSQCSDLKGNKDSDVEITGIFDDSRKVKKGGLFVATLGIKSDGHNYINEAIDKGAVAIIYQIEPPEKKKDVIYISSSDSRDALGEIAKAWYDNVADKLKIIGVTGTDGKTTTCSIIYHLLKENGYKVGIISTLGAEINGEKSPIGLHVTSPETLLLHELLADMAQKEAEYVVLEVTSHGIDQKRISGISFDIGVLTNITHEHLDYHKTFEDYSNTKINFLLKCPIIITNKDDSSFEIISKSITTQKLLTYGLDQKADTWAENTKGKDKLSFDLCDKNQKVPVQTQITGKYNVLNILAANLVVNELGVKMPSVAKEMEKFMLPEGRQEEVSNDLGIKIIVDFAHTPNALEKTLETLREQTQGRLISVFGCAGERDFTKRPKMGAISAQLSDISIFTAEDPRSEDIFEILSQMEIGAKEKGAKIEVDYKKLDSKTNSYFLVPERHEAIALGLMIAQKGDTLVVCGKGHEISMAFDGVEHPWKDKEIITDILNTNPDYSVVVFAGGVGKRMESDKPKVLHKIAGRPMISYTLEKFRRAGFGNIVMVVGHKREEVIAETQGAVSFAVQEIQLGTGDALAKGLEKVSLNIKNIIAVNGDDSGFYDPGTIKKVVKTHDESQSALTFVSLEKEDPTGLGRIVRDEKGKVAEIVEEKEASGEQKKIKEINVGFYVFKKEWLDKNINKIKLSSVGEYFVVDLIKMAISQGEKIEVYKLGSGNEWVGVNTQDQLSQADRLMRQKLTK